MSGILESYLSEASVKEQAFNDHKYFKNIRRVKTLTPRLVVRICKVPTKTGTLALKEFYEISYTLSKRLT